MKIFTIFVLTLLYREGLSSCGSSLYNCTEDGIQALANILRSYLLQNTQNLDLLSTIFPNANDKINFNYYILIPCISTDMPQKISIAWSMDSLDLFNPIFMALDVASTNVPLSITVTGSNGSIGDWQEVCHTTSLSDPINGETRLQLALRVLSTQVHKYTYMQSNLSILDQMTIKQVPHLF